jgi:hypothetical protein
MASKILLLINNKPVPNPILVKAGDVTPIVMTVVRTASSGPQPPSDGFTIKTSCYFKIDKVEGQFDASGKATVTIGPGPIAMRGDVQCTVSLNNDPGAKADFNVRFH